MSTIRCSFLSSLNEEQNVQQSDTGTKTVCLIPLYSTANKLTEGEQAVYMHIPFLTVSSVYMPLSFLKRCLHESGLSFNPDRTHPVSVHVEIIGD